MPPRSSCTLPSTWASRAAHLDVATQILEGAGASATDSRYALDRHWRNARTHTLHDPLRWKHHHVGAYVLSGTHPPNHGQL